MQASVLQKKNTGKEKYGVDSRIRICINCGNINVDLYEFGMSCESCGISLYFGLYSK